MRYRLRSTVYITALLIPLLLSAGSTLAADQGGRSPMPSVNGVDAGAFIVPAEGRLDRLVGTTDIAVLDNVDDRFVRGMTGYPLFTDEVAGRVSETDLFDSVQAGRTFSRDSQAALARQEQTRAQTGQARGLLLPSLNAQASRGYENSKPSVIIDPASGELVSSDTHMRTDASMTLRQPLFNLPDFLDWRRRKIVEQSRSENFRASDGDAFLDTVRAYVSLVSSRLQADVTRDFETRLAELLDYIEKRTNAGASSVSDMARVRARIQETLSTRLEQESAHATAGVEFVRLTNFVPSKLRLPTLDDVGGSLLPVSFDAAVQLALQRNPEIAALTLEASAARADQKVAQARYLPRLDAEYSDTFSRGAGGDDDPRGQRDRRLMLVLNWNLLSGGKDHYTRVERSARHRELQYRLDDQRRRVIQALSSHFSALETTRERIVFGYQELESIATAAQAMSKRMLAGNQSLLDLLDVYDRFYQARSRLISLHLFEISTVAQLIRLTHGTPWTVDADSLATAAEPQSPSALDRQDL